MCLYFLIFFSSDIGLLPIIVLVRSCLLYPLLGEIVVVAAIDHFWWWWWSWSWWWLWKKWYWQWWWYWLAGGLVGCVNQWRWQNLPPNAHGLTLGGAVVGFTYTVIFSIILVVVSVYCISQLMRKHCDHNILQSITYRVIFSIIVVIIWCGTQCHLSISFSSWWVWTNGNTLLCSISILSGFPWALYVFPKKCEDGRENKSFYHHSVKDHFAYV